MPTPQVNTFSEADARLILDTVKQLRASGWKSGPDSQRSLTPTDRPTFFYNDSGESIPPYSIMHVTGTIEIGPQNFVKVDKFDEDIDGAFLFNGHYEIDDKDTGIAQPGNQWLAKTDGATVADGELWGPADGTWTLDKNAGPFWVVGEDDLADDLGE